MSTITTFLERGLMDDGFPVRVIQTEASFLFAPHWHEETEIIYVAGKRARIEINNRVCELGKGDILIIKPGDVHSFLPGTCKLLIIVFRLHYLTGSFPPDHDLQQMKKVCTQMSIIPAYSAEKANLALIMKAIADEEMNRQSGYRWAMKARMYDLLVQLVRLKTTHLEPSIECTSPQTKKFASIEEVCGYLEQHYDQNLKLDDIADHANFNKYYLCKLFKAMRGVTLMDYLNQFRISKAEWELLRSKDSILEIAVQHGFNNLNSFNRLFKKYNGCTPSEFRKRNAMNSAIYQ